jgi:hypothetical protein
VRAVALGTTGANYSLFSTTASRDGFAGFFRNTGSGADPNRGHAIRVLGAGATGSEFPSFAYAGAGEFAGPNGVVGYSTFDKGAGVAGFSGAKGDIGIYGITTQKDGYAGFFKNQFGPTDSGGTGIRALAAGAVGSEIDVSFFRGGGEFIGNNGVIGAAAYKDGFGVLGIQGAGDYALYSFGAAYIKGNLEVSGHLTKGSGTFKIDHPLDPANRYLSHSFVESPDMKNVYDGVATTDAEGRAVVDLPDYFEALNRDPRYQLTVIGAMAQAIIEKKISDNSFTIRASEPNVEVSWQVTGIRKDAFALAHPVIVEEEKAVADRGHYLHPVELGEPASLAIQRGPQTASVAEDLGRR